MPYSKNFNCCKKSNWIGIITHFRQGDKGGHCCKELKTEKIRIRNRAESVRMERKQSGELLRQQF
jgi:hypothetical protein